MVETVRVIGLDQMRRVLKRLPGRVQRRVVNKSLREGAKVVQAKALDNALSQFHGGEGFLAEHIAIAKQRGRRFESRYSVGVRGGAKEYAPGRRKKFFPFYWRFLEFGTSKMRARPFLRPAGTSTTSQQTATIKRELIKGVQREVNKLI